MTTTADLIASARRHLLGRERQALNQLTADISSATTTVTFSQPLGGIQAGAVIAVDLEEMLVWSADASNSTATVLRGHNGSAAAAHTGGTVVAVNPKFSNWELFAALNDDLFDLSAPDNGLFQIRTLDLTYASGVYGYDFPTLGYLSVADIRWQVPAVITHEWREISDYDVSLNLPTGTFPSGAAIFFGRGAAPTPQQTVRIRYRSTFGALTGLTDDVPAVTGLPATALDIPPLGAALRVMAGRPVSRADFLSQGDTRRADEVRVGDVAVSTTKLEALRARRIAAEYTRLTATWPMLLRARTRV